ncbi:MAG: acetyl-CoA carboxylase carboxyl transferase subunit beta [Rickettsiales bacterium]|nr:acetyl-CoA carboxylase carboxyl transferase subunit beta [Rickettsiales bacterium]
MNWITNYVKPKLQAIVGKKEIPDNLWETCNKCSQMLLKRELESNSYVCKHCDYHFRLNSKKRLELFFGKNFVIIETPKVKSDPLKFRDTKKYNDRLKEAQKKNSSNDSVLVASGTLKDRKIVVAIFDFNFMGGSMGMAAGEAIIAACEHAKKNRLPLVIFSSSGGARMQEGILSLMQMPRTVSAINSLDKEKLPFISVLTDPTTGGVSASFAMLGDIIIAEKNATIGFAGSRVIEETIKEKLPDNFQKSEYLLEKGMVDIVCHRKDLNEKINNILVYLCE